jgi:hypothetical protein
MERGPARTAEGKHQCQADAARDQEDPGRDRVRTEGSVGSVDNHARPDREVRDPRSEAALCPDREGRLIRPACGRRVRERVLGKAGSLICKPDPGELAWPEWLAWMSVGDNAR